MATQMRAASGAVTHPAAPGTKDHFLRLMFFQASDMPVGTAVTPEGHAHTHRYRPLAQATLRRGETCRLPATSSHVRVLPDSPASTVMTNLQAVAPVLIHPAASVDEANRTMISRGVRALFVVDEGQQVVGLVTSFDVLGEKPMVAVQQRGIHRDEISVRDIMTPVDLLEFLSMKDVRHASVGDVVMTLMRSGRQHALVCEEEHRLQGIPREVVGMFSLTQVARQLGVQLDADDVRHMFSAIESAVD